MFSKYRAHINDATLRKIVEYIDSNLHCSSGLEKNPKSHSLKSSGTHTSNSLPIMSSLFLEKINSVWPLKKGSVKSEYIAWNVYSNQDDCVRFLTSFTIKCFALLSEKEPLYFFTENLFQIFFWSHIKEYYFLAKEGQTEKNRVQFCTRFLQFNKPVFLCLENTFFKIRSGSNFELSALEEFVDDLCAFNCPLIVFSMQEFLKKEEKNSRHKVSYKIEKDHFKITLQDALEPNVLIAASRSLIDPLKTSCFDKLLEALALGQDFVFSIEKSFKEFYKPGTV